MSIECPAAGDSVKVTLLGTGPVRTICAHGRVTAFRPGPVMIQVKVYQGHSPTIPSIPEGQLVAPVGQNWFVAAVPVPVSSPTPPGAQLTIVAWTVAGTGALARDVQKFFGLEGAGTDCCAGSVLVAPESRRVQQGVALSMAPVLWSVLGAGFGAGAAVFNGNWSLTLREIVGGFCVWDNGGDADRTPLVELRCESPLVVTWQLRFRNGSSEVHYALPAVKWNPLNSNVLCLDSGDGFPRGALPESLTVKPG